ncbi:hypothetical protein RDI58_013920 [Solanum bulbocastanum]|uniref:Uncharacterized protein n=1 Tax=Solanum bulbocastanum TaxID=147425 RepID=A0AAN8YEN7_SOLBU
MIPNLRCFSTSSSRVRSDRRSCSFLLLRRCASMWRYFTLLLRYCRYS